MSERRDQNEIKLGYVGNRDSRAKRRRKDRHAIPGRTGCRDGRRARNSALRADQVTLKPAVPLGGKNRLIDISISNCINSGTDRIFVLTQFLSASLHRHVQRTYRFDVFSDGFVEILAAEQTHEGDDWYQGTADAVRQQMHNLVSRGAEDVLVLAGDHLY